ncbi:MAG: methyl-accepting chemotaxis protein [Sulfuriflexus sp.]|nr:methyl-accepting chemotaxis protein [Sulfuriflexus sp.]
MKRPKMTLKTTLVTSALATLTLVALMLISSNAAMSNLMQIAVDSGLKDNSELQLVASSAWTVLLVFAFVIFILIAGIVFYISKNFAQPIHNLSTLMKQVCMQRDLSLRAEEKGSQEVVQIAIVFNKMLSEFETLINGVQGSVGLLKEATQGLSSVTEKSHEDMSMQQSESQQLATAMNQMAATAQEVAKNAADAASAVHDAESSAQESAEIAVAAMCAMDNLVMEVDSAATVITKLKEDSSSIGMVLDVIKGIAEQTNLLALNAAIEAARAGEQGRGFAVVADEVRTLASRTQESTNEIQLMIEKLQTGTHDAVEVMMHAKELGEGGSAQTEATAEALAEISGSVKSISDMTTQIASAAEEQTATAEDMSRNIVNIMEASESTVEGSRQTSETTEHLKSLSEQLHGVLEDFSAQK